MRYISTRGAAPALSFEEVLLAGLASDGGLYVPETLPRFSRADISAMRGLPYPALAQRVIAPFVADAVPEDDLRAILEDCYASFRHGAVAPLVQLGPNQWIMELFHGPTLAFKDFALQLLGRLLDYVLERRGEKVVIMGATSGDTGSAAIDSGGAGDTGAPGTADTAEAHDDTWMTDDGTHPDIDEDGDGLTEAAGDCDDGDDTVGLCWHQVSAGGYHTCGIDSSGSVQCWGSDATGQASPPSGSFASVSSGWYHSCGIRTDGELICWGGTEYAGSLSYYAPETPPAGTFVSVSSGYEFTCALDSTGSLQCWGNSWEGKTTPPSGTFESLSSGVYHSCALDSEGNMQCWGSNSNGQTSSPAGTWQAVGAGGYHTCGVDSTGSMQCWGRNTHDECEVPEL